MTTDRPVDELLFADEVAEQLRKSLASFRYMLHRGDGPRSAKIGGRLMFRRSDVDAWLDAQFDESA